MHLSVFNPRGGGRLRQLLQGFDFKSPLPWVGNSKTFDLTQDRMGMGMFDKVAQEPGT